jgi:hypothetical protein
LVTLLPIHDWVQVVWVPFELGSVKRTRLSAIINTHCSKCESLTRERVVGACSGSIDGNGFEAEVGEQEILDGMTLGCSHLLRAALELTAGKTSSDATLD